MLTPLRSFLRRLATTASTASLLLAAASAQTLSLNFRDAVPLGGTATDQNGVSFAVTGVSGVTHLGGTAYACALDNSDKVLFLDVTLTSDGSIQTSAITGGLTLDDTRDFEGIAYAGAGSGSVFLAEEGTPAVHEYALADGAFLQSLATPSVFANRRPNLGFEALARLCSGDEMWTANEEALTVDGPRATPTGGTTVRLLRYDANGQAAQQHAYEVDAMPGPYLPGPSGQSGLSDLVELPNGTLLALERSLALANPLFEARIYEVDFTGATDVSGLPALSGATYTPVSKQLLWSGSLSNLEGLALGPRLANDRWALLGVVDDGDPLSQNTLVSFELTGLPPGDCACFAESTCTSAPNSTGSGAFMGSSGSVSVAANDLVLHCSSAPSLQPGIFYYGDQSIEVAFGDGFRCVGGTTFRLLPPLVTDGLGSASRPVDLAAPPAAASITADSTWSFQFWYRDPATAGAGFNLSDGLRIRFCP